MARLRDDHSLFTSRDAEILAIGPNDRPAFEAYWAEHRISFAGLPDPQHTVANLYGQQVKLLKWGRMPLACIVDRHGMIRYAHFGSSMSDIPGNDTLLEMIDAMNAESVSHPG